MKKADAIAYFGSVSKLAAALGLGQPSVSEWGDIVPPLRQLQIQHLTGGRLQAEPEVFQIRRGRWRRESKESSL
jgi:DNA-binding transcriptional regulator YdaS (Cro superfamily)